MINRDTERRAENDLVPGEEFTGTQPDRGPALSTADLAGRNRDVDRDAVPDSAERPMGAGGAAPVQPMEADRAAPAPTAAPRGAEERATPLFAAGDAEGYRTRWMEVQTGFVDDPRQTVQQADTLVAEVMKRLAEVFADERANLEQQWSRGEEADTESLRLALRRYRSFFDRLLSI